VSNASTSNIKDQADGYKPITPNHIQDATFYGLATAAGDSTQKNSSNTVGTYTDTAKVAIQKMLGIYQAPWELIKAGTFTNDPMNFYNITTDQNDQPFELTDVILIFSSPKQDTDFEKGASGSFRFYYGSGLFDYKSAFAGAYVQTANSPERVSIAKVIQTSNLLEVSAAYNQEKSHYDFMHTYAANTPDNPPYNHAISILSAPLYFNKVELVAVKGTAKYWLYGRRRWT
jgi:hypothetical protein